jgi:hypothetical protein
MLKRRDVLIILWMTFITVVAWIGFSIYHISVTSTIKDIDASAIAPIDPNFDMGTINKLKSREKVEPVYQFSETTAENVATPSASGSNATETAEISPTPIVSGIPQVSGTP